METDTRLTHRPLREVVAEEIRAMIMGGQIAPGERLIEDKLAAELGVSRNPVREAIRSLEATGLVDVVPRKGAYACLVDGNDIRQIQELRAAINGWAAELAAVRRTDGDVRRLRSCVEAGRAASTPAPASTARWPPQVAGSPARRRSGLATTPTRTSGRCRGGLVRARARAPSR